MAVKLRENASTKQTTVTGIDAIATGTTELYVVPAGKSLVVTQVVVRCTSFTAGGKTTHAVASFGGNATAYDDYLGTFYTIEAANVAIISGVSGVAVPVYPAGTSFRLAIETASDADVEEWAVDVFGYLVEV